MVQFEYTVQGMGCLKEGDNFYRGYADDSQIEKVINSYAEKGLEYQNSIILPSTSDGEYYLKPYIYMVFRRAKS
jgi:hypothetical protein